MVKVVLMLLPIMMLVASGLLLLRFGFYTNEFRQGLDRFVYWIALPALVIGMLVGAPAIGPEAGWTSLALSVATLMVTAVAYGFARWRRMPGPAVGAFAQASLRGNLGFVGLPVIVLATPDHAIVTQAALVMAPTMVLYNVLSVVLLELPRHRLGWSVLPRIGWSLAINPLILASVLGIVLNVLNVSFPTPVHQTVGMLGATAAPLALLSLGGTLVVYRVRDHVGRAVVAGLMKTAFAPAFAWGVGWAMGLDGQAMLILLVFTASPTAVASYVLAVQLEGDEGLAASSIVVSTLMSAASLVAALAIAGAGGLQ